MSLKRKNLTKWQHEKLTRTKTIEEELEHSGKPARNRRQRPTVVGIGRVGEGGHLHHNIALVLAQFPQPCHIKGGQISSK